MLVMASSMLKISAPTIMPITRMTKGSNNAVNRLMAARAQINSFMTALGSYKLDTGTFPTTEQGLQALRVKPENMTQWAGPYLPQDAPMDPWAHPYLYKFPGDHGDEPDLISLGADGEPGGEGNNADIVSWSNQ